MVRLFFLLFFIAQLSYAQSLAEVEKTPLKVDTFIGIDSYNSLYFTKGMVLHKKSSSQNFQFTDFQLGAITSVDVINPLNVVVFYGDTNTAVLLDNRLSEIERIQFNNLPEFLNISAATNAGGNRLWVFNIDSQQLELYNYRTGRSSIISQPITANVISQTSNFNYCYILTEKKIRVYNIFGGIVHEIPISEATKIVQHNENYLVLKNNQLHFYKQNTPEPKVLKTPNITIKDLQLTQDFLYIYDREFLYKIALNQPKN